MAELEGYLDNRSDGLIRVHDVADPHRYSELAIEHIASFRDVTDDPVAHVVLRDDAEVVDGFLDDDSFRALFSVDPVSGHTSVRPRETAYPQCYSWNPPGGGGFC